MLNLLIIDDDKNILKTLNSILSKDYLVFTADSLKSARKLISDNYIDIVILDVKLPDGNGINFIGELLNLYDNIIIIMATASNNIRDAIEALKNGAADYLIKPYNIDELKIILAKCVETGKLKRRIEVLETEIDYLSPHREIIGESPAIRKVFEKLSMIYDKDVSILIRGASGTGKELIARDIHFKSDRRKLPFIPVNCAAIPDTLIENELFGHKRGSYTGAYSFQRGKFELAEDGVIFLDEIGALSASAQIKLLRVLQEKTFIRIGDTREIKTGARVICATSTDLETAVKNGLFREDLYYRINIFPVFLPLLKERDNDIELLANFFVKQFNKKYNLNIAGIDNRLLEIFKNYNWPGNIRELENLIERLCLISKYNILSTELLEKTEELRDKFLGVKREIDKSEIVLPGNLKLEQYTTRIIEARLARNKNHISRTADELGITRKTLVKKLRARPNAS